MTIFRQTNKKTVVIQFQSIENLTSVPWMSKFRDFVLYFDVLYRFFTGREIHAVFPARANVCVFPQPFSDVFRTNKWILCF